MSEFISKLTEVTFEQWTTITQKHLFIIAIGLVWLLPIIIYFIVGATARGRSISGKITSEPMIKYSNFWYAFIIWFFFQSALILIAIIFPLWLNLFT